VIGRSAATWLALSLSIPACSTRGWVLSAKGEAAASVDDAGNAPSPERFAAVCSPAVTFRNGDAGARSALFDQAVPDPNATVVNVARQVCSLLYREPRDVPVVAGIALTVEPFDGVGESSNDGLRLSSTYLQSVADQNGDVRGEITGILYFLITSVYQYSDEGHAAPSWVVSGVGDCVRYEAGHTALSRRQAGGYFTDGFRTTGFFFAWLTDRYPGFLYDLNASLSPSDGVTWSPGVFESLTGESVQALWTAYQASL
jgi:hypothetical protein